MPPSLELSGTHSGTCSLLLYLHVPKTGGTSVIEVFKKLPRRKHIYLGDEKGSGGGPFRFYAMLPEVFGDLLPKLTPAHPHPGFCRDANGTRLARALRAGACGATHIPLDWRSSHLVGEVHDPVGAVRFRDEIRPRIARLRAAYGRAGCAFQVSTVLRDPSSQAISNFRYEIVRRKPNSSAWRHRVHTTSFFTRWLRARHDWQLAGLTGCFATRREAQGLRNGGVGGCAHHRASGGVVDDALALEARSLAARDDALKLLREEMDLVGVTRELSDYIRTLATRLGVWLKSGGVGGGGVGSGGRSSLVLLCNGNQQSVPSLDDPSRLWPSLRAEIARSTAIDAVLYAAAANLSAAVSAGPVSSGGAGAVSTDGPAEHQRHRSRAATAAGWLPFTAHVSCEIDEKREREFAEARARHQAYLSRMIAAAHLRRHEAGAAAVHAGTRVT